MPPHATVPEKLLPAAFFAELRDLWLSGLPQQAARTDPGEIRKALYKTPLDLGDAAVLLAAARRGFLDQLLERARSLTDSRFGRSILLYAPCYLSSFCVNHCEYCGFNFRMTVPRRCLTPDEAMGEISLLAGRGFRRILLVAGEYPAKVLPEYIVEVLGRARSLVPELDLEVGPSTEPVYRNYVQAGAGGVVCYQETYDPVRYARLHLRGPKSFYQFRLGTLERAGAAGVNRLGVGVLIGLADPVQDLLALIAHARFLGDRFPGASLTVSLPRLRPAVPGFRGPHPVDDESLLRFFAILRLALPRVGLVISTRERADLRRRLLQAGITQMSAGSVTVPGAYGSGKREGGQFDVADHRSVAEVIADLANLGYAVRWTGMGADPAASRGPS